MASPCPIRSGRNDWMTVSEAVRFEFQQTPRRKPIHRSGVYRWIHDGKVEARKFGDHWYINRSSLSNFCRGQLPQRLHSPRPSGIPQALAARARILSGVNAPKTGGER